MKVLQGNLEITVTPRQFEIIYFMMQNKGANIWGNKYYNHQEMYVGNKFKFQFKRPTREVLQERGIIERNPEIDRLVLNPSIKLIPTPKPV